MLCSVHAVAGILLLAQAIGFGADDNSYFAARRKALRARPGRPPGNSQGDPPGSPMVAWPLRVAARWRTSPAALGIHSGRNTTGCISYQQRVNPALAWYGVEVY